MKTTGLLKSRIYLSKLKQNAVGPLTEKERTPIRKLTAIEPRLAEHLETYGNFLIVKLNRFTSNKIYENNFEAGISINSFIRVRFIQASLNHESL